MRTVILMTGLVALGVCGGALISGEDVSPAEPAAIALAASQERGEAAVRRGPRGPRGRRGPAGFGQITIVDGPSVNLTPQGSGIGTSEASCPSGSTVIGGGWDTTTPPARIAPNLSHAVGAKWVVTMTNSGGTVGSFNAEAMCARRGRSRAN